MVQWLARRAFLCAILCGSLYLAAGEAALAQVTGADPAPAAESADASGATPVNPAEGEANAAIAQRLLTAGRPVRCGVPGRDGTIVVCGGRAASDKERLPLRDELESARSTNDGLPRAPNVSSLPDCSKGCLGFGSVPPPMYYFDITKLPEAPPDSDADKIARGEIRAP